MGPAWMVKPPNPTTNGQDVNKTIVNESQPQTFPVNDECSPLLDHSDPKITNQQDLNLKQQEKHYLTNILTLSIRKKNRHNNHLKNAKNVRRFGWLTFYSNIILVSFHFYSIHPYTYINK